MTNLKITFYSSEIITLSTSKQVLIKHSQDTFPSYYFEQSILWRRYIHIKEYQSLDFFFFGIFRENLSWYLKREISQSHIFNNNLWAWSVQGKILDIAVSKLLHRTLKSYTTHDYAVQIINNLQDKSITIVILSYSLDSMIISLTDLMSFLSQLMR